MRHINLRAKFKVYTSKKLPDRTGVAFGLGVKLAAGKIFEVVDWAAVVVPVVATVVVVVVVVNTDCVGVVVVGSLSGCVVVVAVAVACLIVGFTVAANKVIIQRFISHDTNENKRCTFNYRMYQKRQILRTANY